MFKNATGVILPPPLIYLLFLAAAWLLDAMLPIALPQTLWTRYIGWGLIDAGVLLMLWAGLLMLWRKTTVNPYGKPAKLLEEGPFRFSRNPIYLADSLIYGGIALLWGSLWPWLLLPLVILTMQRGVIVHETAPASYGWATVANSWGVPQFDILRQNAAAERVAMEGWIQRDVAVDLFRRAGLDFEALKVQARSRDFQPVPLPGAAFSTEFDVATSQVTTHNVIARLPGTARPDETVLYTAHWDHIGMGEPDATGDRIFNGAVDNASGTSGLLELARAYGRAPRTERSIVMISFTAEESGLLGAEYYASNPVYPLAKTVGGFNMDSMNVYGRVTGLGVTGYGQSDFDERLAAAIQPQGRTLVPDHENAAGTYYRSDHFPLAKRGVPMAYAGSRGDFRDEPIAERQAARSEYGANRYHQAADEWSPDWDYSGMIEDLTVFYEVGRDLANSREWPEWKPGSEFGPVRAETAAQRRP